MSCYPLCHVTCDVVSTVVSYYVSCHVTCNVVSTVVSYYFWYYVTCDVVSTVVSYCLWCYITCHVVSTMVSYCGVISSVVSYYMLCRVTCRDVMWCCAPSVRSCYLWWCFTCDVMFYPWHHVTRVGTFLHVTCLTELRVWCHSGMKSFVTYMCHLWCHVSFSFILFVLPWLFWLEKASCLKGKMAMFSCFCWLISLCSPPLTCKSMVACF